MEFVPFLLVFFFFKEEQAQVQSPLYFLKGFSKLGQRAREVAAGQPKSRMLVLYVPTLELPVFSSLGGRRRKTRDRACLTGHPYPSGRHLAVRRIQRQSPRRAARAEADR